MRFQRGNLTVVAGLMASTALYGCASFPTMKVAEPTTTVSGATLLPGSEVSVGPAPGRGGRGGDGGDLVRGPASRSETIPGTATARTAPVTPASADEIAALVPAEPLNAVLTPQPLPQYLNTVFSDVLHVPYTLGPGLATRTDVIQVNAPATMSKRDYIRMLQAALRNYGLTLSINRGSIMITEDGAGATGGATGSVIRSRSSADAPAGNRQVTWFFPLVALRADGIQTAAGAGGQVTFTPDAAANAFIIQGQSRLVATAVDLLSNLDKPAFAGGQVLRLQSVFWSPDNYAQALSTTLSAEGFIVGTDPLGPKSIMIVPLPTTNQTLVFAADRETMARVQYWANQLDQPSAEGLEASSTYVYEVRNTSASLIGQMLVNAGSQANATGAAARGGFANQVNNALGQPGGAAAAGRGGAANVNAGRGGAAAGGANNAGRGGAANNAGRAGAATNARGGAATTTAARNGQAVAGSVPSGGTITVDDTSNRILFTGSPSEYSQLRGLLQKLDAPAREVLVEVTVAEVSLTDDTQVGLEWFFSHNTSGGNTISGGTRTFTTTSTTTGTPPVTTTAETAVSGLGLGTNGLNLNFSTANGDLRAAFNAFASNNKVNVLSRPRLSARSGTSAEINVGVDVPIITSQQAANTGAANGLANVVQQITYRSTGVILDITPTVYGDDRVDLQVYQEVSSVQDNPNPNIQSPYVPNRNLTTTLSLADGHTAVLGGLMQDNYAKANSGVPFLKDIPVLGAIFRKDRIQGQKTELVVLITPFIIRDEDDMTSLTNQVSSEVNDAFKAGRGGSYTLTPWSGGGNFGLDLPSSTVTGASLQRPPSSVKAP